MTGEKWKASESQKQDYILYQGKAVLSHKRGNWQCTICGKTRPKYERAQIIGQVEATHGYKSREKNERWGIPEQENTTKKKRRKGKKK